MCKKKKILFIMHMPPPMHGAAQIGQYIHDSKIINENFECLYINPSASSDVKDVGKLSIRKISFLFERLLEIKRVVKEWNPDLVYITPSAWDWGFYRDFLTVRLLKSQHCKIVSHFHNKGVDSFESRWYNKKLYRSFFKGMKVIFLSNKLVDEFREYLSPLDIYICPNGIVPQNTSNIHRNQCGSPYSFLFLSNMMEEKGVWILLEACKILHEKGVDFNCHYIGKWADITEDMFNQRLLQMNLTSCVYAHGPQYGASKIPFFQKSDAFVFPSYYHGETFGLVLLEAMDFGLPVIGTGIAGMLDVIEDNITGFQVMPRDPVSLSRVMQWLIENPQKSIEMGQKGREKFSNEYTVDIFERNIYNILQNCLK